MSAQPATLSQARRFSPIQRNAPPAPGAARSALPKSATATARCAQSASGKTPSDSRLKARPTVEAKSPKSETPTPQRISARRAGRSTPATLPVAPEAPPYKAPLQTAAACSRGSAPQTKSPVRARHPRHPGAARWKPFALIPCFIMQQACRKSVHRTRIDKCPVRSSILNRGSCTSSPPKSAPAVSSMGLRLSHALRVLNFRQGRNFSL